MRGAYSYNLMSYAGVILTLWQRVTQQCVVEDWSMLSISLCIWYQENEIWNVRFRIFRKSWRHVSSVLHAQWCVKSNHTIECYQFPKGLGYFNSPESYLQALVHIYRILKRKGLIIKKTCHSFCSWNKCSSYKQ